MNCTKQNLENQVIFALNYEIWDLLLIFSIFTREEQLCFAEQLKGCAEEQDSKKIQKRYNEIYTFWWELINKELEKENKEKLNPVV